MYLSVGRVSIGKMKLAMQHSSQTLQGCLAGYCAYPVQLPQVAVDRPEGEDCVLCRHLAALPSKGALEHDSRALAQVHNRPHAC